MSETRSIAPTVAEVERIAALEDPVVRNLQITQCYHELAVALSALTSAGANWCTVATWASRQAGQSIRKEDLVRTLEDLVAGYDETEMAAATPAMGGSEAAGAAAPNVGAALGVLWQALNPAAAFQRTSDAVARGNNKVFQEIGYEFARFLALFVSASPNATSLAAFLSALRPGDPPEGQGYLRRAFSHYHQALAQPDPKARTEMLLLANLEIGFHEQNRLQPEIVEALNALIYDPAALRRKLLDVMVPDPGSRLRLFLARLSGRARPLLAARDRLATDMQNLGHLAITEHMMTLRLPRGRLLRLGQDLRVQFPAELEQIDLPDLRALLDQVDPTPDSLSGSGAEDWGNLTDRMRFITDLFRAFHLDASLFDPPFSQTQVKALKAGERPEGRL